MTLRTLLSDCLHDAEHRIGWSPKTIKAYGCHISTLINWLEETNGRPAEPADFTLETLQTYDTMRKNTHKSQRTRDAGISAFKTFARYLTAHKHMEASELVSIGEILRVRVTEKAKQARVTRVQVSSLFEACDKLPKSPLWYRKSRPQLCRAVLAVMVYAALRRSEVVALHLNDISLGETPSLLVRCGKGNCRSIRTLFAICKSGLPFAQPVGPCSSRST